MAGAACAFTCLDDAQAVSILLMLGPQDAVRAQASSRSGVLAKASSGGTIWRAHAERVFGLHGSSALEGPTGGGLNAETSNTDEGRAVRANFALWYAAANEVNLRQAQDNSELLPLPASWIAAWQLVFRWSRRESCRDLVEGLGLRGPVDPEVLRECERSGLKLAPEVAGMWQVCDGQECVFHPQLAPILSLPELTEEMAEDGRWATGIFGGYVVYDHMVSTRLLPLHAALRLTLFMQERIPQMHNTKKLIFAASFDCTKMITVDTGSGQVAILAPHPRARGYCFERAAPGNADSPHSQLLRWFQTLSRRLDDDFYPVCPLNPALGRLNTGLCLLPQKEPEATCCVTRGVEVSASCVYMPEHAQGWTYSISLRLVGTAEERGFDQCQLSTRTWQIQEDGQQQEQVHGEGVIGFFPILVDGGWLLNRESDPHGQYPNDPGVQQGAFRYQSCSGRSASMRGTFGGILAFVPGTMKKPTGPPFDARLEAFRLCVPEFIY